MSHSSVPGDVDDEECTSTLSRSAVKKRKTVFSTLIRDFEDHRIKKLDCVEERICLEKDFKVISECSSSDHVMAVMQTNLQTELSGYITKSIDDQSHLIDSLLAILSNREYQFGEENQRLSTIERCGSVLYTMTYEYMLEKHSMVRKRGSASSSTYELKTIKRDLRRFALTETLNALSILESCLRHVLDSNSNCITGRFAHFFQRPPIVNQITSLLVTAPDLADQITECVSVRSVALVNADGNIRKVTKPVPTKRKRNQKSFERPKQFNSNSEISGDDMSSESESDATNDKQLTVEILNKHSSNTNTDNVSVSLESNPIDKDNFQIVFKNPIAKYPKRDDYHSDCNSSLTDEGIDETTTACSESTTILSATSAQQTNQCDVDMTKTDLHRMAVAFVESPPSTILPHNAYGKFTPVQSLCYDKHLTIELKWFLDESNLLFVHSVLSSKATQVSRTAGPMQTIRNNYIHLPGIDELVNDDDKRGAYSIELKQVCNTPELNVSVLNKRNKAKGKLAISNQLNNMKDQRFANIIHWILNILKDNGLVPHDCHPCAASGATNSLHLLVAEVGCMPQHFHYDYDPESFRDASDAYKGSSMILNYMSTTVTIDVGWLCHDPTKRKTIQIPPLSLFIFRGDLKHAGSENKSLNSISKYFWYLDPHDITGYRSRNGDTLFYDDDQELTYILTPEDAVQFKRKERGNGNLKVGPGLNEHLVILAEAVSKTIDMR